MGLFDNDLLGNDDYKMYMHILHELEQLQDPARLEELQNALMIHKTSLIDQFGRSYLELRRII